MKFGIRVSWVDIKEMSKVYIPPYIHRLMDYIYISDYRSAIDFDKFSLVIDLNYPQNGVQEGEIEESYVGSTHVIKIGIQENTSEDIAPYFNKVFPFIQTNVADKKRTLILSHEGVGRSATVFSSYLIRQYQFSLNDISHLFQTRGYSPRMNINSVNQLAKYITECSKLTSPTPTLSSSQKIDDQISRSYLSQ